MRLSPLGIFVAFLVAACGSSSERGFTGGQDAAAPQEDAAAPDDSPSPPHPPCEVPPEGGVPFGTSGCTACAVTSCCQEVNDCASSAGCESLAGCLASCAGDAGTGSPGDGAADDGGGTADCEHACRGQFSAGAATYQALADCAQSRCATTCGP